MLFALDIENNHISIGVYDGDRKVFVSRLSTVRDRSADEYAFLISGAFSMNRTDPAAIDGAVIGSVVRPLNQTLQQAVETLMQVKPLMIGPGVKTGLSIKTDLTAQIGADIVANAVAATSLEKSPLVILALGTATTLTGMNDKGELSGVLICPGVRSSLDALSASAAELPYVSLDQPKVLLGKNTIDSMVSGSVYGHAAMIDGLLDRIAAEWKASPLKVIATGDLAESVLPYCRPDHEIRYEPDLTLLGLKKVYALNTWRRP